jgi:hypothetical protein
MGLANGGTARHSPGQSNYLLTASLGNMFVHMAMPCDNARALSVKDGFLPENDPVSVREGGEGAANAESGNLSSTSEFR